MNYKEYGYNEFMNKVADGVYIITELELREQKSVMTTKSLMGTGENWDYTEHYPEEIGIYYDICIEYVVREDLTKGKLAFLCEAIAFSAPGKDMHNDKEAYQKAREIYDELLRKRVPKTPNKKE